MLTHTIASVQFKSDGTGAIAAGPPVAVADDEELDDDPPHAAIANATKAVHASVDIEANRPTPHLPAAL